MRKSYKCFGWRKQCARVKTVGTAAVWLQGKVFWLFGFIFKLRDKVLFEFVQTNWWYLAINGVKTESVF